MSIDCNIIQTGSTGNATILNDFLMIDCGVPYSKIEPYVHGLKLVLLTHRHTDHFNKATIKRLAFEKPKLRFGCCDWMLPRLEEAGVDEERVCLLHLWTISMFGLCNVTPVPLTHDVPNCGYKIEFNNGKKAFYATDTANLNGIRAPNFDLYLVESNYITSEIKARMDAKKEAGEFIYEDRVIQYHMSREYVDAWLAANAGQKSQFIYMHEHVDRPKKMNPDGEMPPGEGTAGDDV